MFCLVVCDIFLRSSVNVFYGLSNMGDCYMISSQMVQKEPIKDSVVGVRCNAEMKASLEHLASSMDMLSLRR